MVSGGVKRKKESKDMCFVSKLASKTCQQTLGEVRSEILFNVTTCGISEKCLDQ